MEQFLRNIFLRFLLVVLIIPVPITGYATENTILRVKADPEDPWVGQKVILTLDVLGKDGWAQLKSVRNSEIKGGYLQRFETQGTRLNETIDGTGYSGQQYEYLFFPQQKGEITIPPIVVDIEIKSWGSTSETKTERLKTPAIVLKVKRPPGVQAVAGLTSTTNFQATQQWEPEKKNLVPGDAITRTITRKAVDVTGMTFSPINQGKITGIGVYPSEPSVNDNYSRGTLNGNRTEKVTYVMEQPGDYLIPDIECNWWNTKSEKLEIITLPGISFTVEGNAAENLATSPVPEPEQTPKTGFFTLIITGFIIAALLIYLFKSRISRFYHSWKKEREESENAFFNKVTDASKSSDPQKMIRATMQWLDRISAESSPARLDLFLDRYVTPGAGKTVVHLLDRSSPGSDAQKVKSFYDMLVKARSTRLKSQHALRQNDLLPKIGFG